MTEQQYRQLDLDSYSTLKVFLEDRRKYYRKYVLKEPLPEDETSSTVFGSVVDCLKFKPEEFESRFALAVAQPPTGQYGKFVDQLMKVTLRSVNGNGEVTRDLEDMMLDAYKEVKFDKDGNIVDFKRDSFEVVKEKFIGTNLEIHYRQLREAYGKTIIEQSTLENAQTVVRELHSNPVTREIMTLRDGAGGGRFSVKDQFAIIGTFDPNCDDIGYPMKCLVDRLIIDHERLLIRIYDLKTAWDNEGEFQSNYFKYKYYIQASLYFHLVKQWALVDSSLKDYEVQYPEFIVAESTNYKNPLIYTTDVHNIHQGMEGFTIRGKYYPGLRKAVQDLIWHKETGIWNISKDAYDSQGILKVRPFVS